MNSIHSSVGKCFLKIDAKIKVIDILAFIINVDKIFSTV